MRKVITTLLSSLLLPIIAFAAYNDVQLSSGSTMVLTVGGSSLEFSVYDGNVQDVQVAASTATFTLAAGSSLSISSANRKTYTYTGNTKTIINAGCSDSVSTLGLSLAAGESAETIVVTPTASACTLPNTGGGGGGGGSPEPEPAVPAEPATPAEPSPEPGVPATPAIPATPAVPAQPAAPAVAQPSPVALLVSPVFNKDLDRGSRGDDVRRLQEILKTDKDVYPEGQVTGYFGPLTRAAIVKFQLKYGVVKSDKDQGAGRVGPKTRAKLKEIFEGGTPAPASQAPAQQAPSANSALQSQIQLLLKQIEALQAQVKARQGN